MSETTQKDLKRLAEKHSKVPAVQRLLTTINLAESSAGAHLAATISRAEIALKALAGKDR
jgi:hypothetical protein